MTDNLRPTLLIVYPNQFGYHTDSYKYCEYLKESFEICYFCYNQGFPIIEMPGIKVYYNLYANYKIKRLYNFFEQIIEHSTKKPIDILFVVQFKFCFLLGLFSRARVKILDYRTGDLRRNAIIRYLNNRIMWFDSLFFDRISAISEGLRDILNLSRTKTLILPLGGDVFTSRPHTFNRLDLLYVGSLSTRNIDQTIKGFAMFLSTNKNLTSTISYTIIGFGNEQSIIKIKNDINKYSLAESINFVGHVKYSELHKYFDSCNIGVAYIPIKPCYQYQPATKTFEYINSGLFTIATSTYENSKIINEKNGVLCNDSPESFALAIESVYKIRHSIIDCDIRVSTLDFRWERIINNILKPYLEN